MSEDPDRLLRRMRAAPPAAFLARLKAQLDAQTPPERPPANRPWSVQAPQWLRRPVHSALQLRLWQVALPALAGSLALTLIGLWLRQTQQAPPAMPMAESGSSSDALVLLAATAAEQKSPPAVAVGSVPRHIRRRGRIAATQEPPLTASTPPVSALGAGGVPAAYAQDLTMRYLTQNGFYNLSGMRIEALSSGPGHCSGGAPPETPVPAGEGGPDSCPPAGEPDVEKTLIGHEVAFLARSAASGALPLSARAIFLALARQVPDPSHPQILVSNPYHLWSDIDPALPPDPIRVLGPPQSTQPGGALLAVLLEPGCREVLPQDTPEPGCQAVRSDEVYVEVPGYEDALLGELRAHPTWLGLLNLELVAQGGEALAVSPVNDVVPAAASILSGAYPAARAVYLSVASRDLRSRPVLSNLVFRYRQLVEEGAVAGPHAALVSSEALQRQLSSITHPSSAEVTHR